MTRVQATALTDKSNDGLNRWLEYVARAVNGQISYGSSMANSDEDMNMQVWKAEGTSPVAPNTDFTIKHSLGRVPNTIVGQDTQDGSVLFRSPTTAWTATTVTLRSTGASSVYKVIVA